MHWFVSIAPSMCCLWTWLFHTASLQLTSVLRSAGLRERDSLRSEPWCARGAVGTSGSAPARLLSRVACQSGWLCMVRHSLPEVLRQAGTGWLAGCRCQDCLRRRFDDGSACRLCQGYRRWQAQQPRRVAVGLAWPTPQYRCARPRRRRRATWPCRCYGQSIQSSHCSS